MVFQEPHDIEVLITVLLTRTLIAPFYRAYVDSLHLQGDERVLDYGAGSGAEARFLARRLLAGGGRLTCVDISRVWTRVARWALRRYPNVECKQGEIAALDIPDGAYDAVVVHFVLHDIPARQRPAIVAHLARKMRPGGQLFIREPMQQERGIPAGEIRRLMKEGGLQEGAASITHSRLTGVMFVGVFRKA